MAALVDTCGWIEWLTDGQLADAFAPYLVDLVELIIPITLQFELYKWARLPLLLTPLTYIHVGKSGKKRSRSLGRYRVNRTRPGLAIDYPTVSVCGRFGFATSIIVCRRDFYASARLLDVPLITADDHFKDLPEVIYFLKKRSTA